MPVVSERVVEVTDADIVTFYKRAFGDEWQTVSERQIFLKLHRIADKWDCDLAKAEKRVGYYVGWLIPGGGEGIPPVWYETHAETFTDVIRLLIQRRGGMPKPKPEDNRPRKNVPKARLALKEKQRLEALAQQHRRRGLRSERSE